VTVHLRFFASLRERLRCSELDWGLPDGATVDDLWAALCARYPQLAALRSSMTFAVNREYVRGDHTLSSGDEVALIPPVSGGMDVPDRFRAD
jgi:molybdopterin converting factor subunit 1